MSRRLGAELLGVHRVGLPVDDVIVKGVLDIGRVLLHAEEQLRVRLVLGEEPLARGAVAGPVGGEAKLARASRARSSASPSACKSMRALSVHPSWRQPQIQVLRNQSVGST